ncbi:MAG: glycosyltransferase family 39 protein [archaeon]
MEEDFLKKVMRFIFNKSNHKYIILLFIIGFLLRIIIASNLDPNADEMIYAPHAVNITSSGLLQEMNEDPLWFYLTDIGYKIFGVNLLTSRLLSIIFGALSIIIIYLLGKEMFNEKIGLISSFLLTFSSFHILITQAEMDVPMTFFIMLSLYFLVKFFKDAKSLNYILSIILLIIAILMKTIAAVFIPAYVIFIIYFNYKKDNKIFYIKNIKLGLIFLFIFFLLMLPTFTFNYLLYKDKGIVDVQFSRFTGVSKNEIYAGISATMEPFRPERVFFSYNGRVPGAWQAFLFYWKLDAILLILFFLGLIVAYTLKNKWHILLTLLFIFPFIFLAGTSLLPPHFVYAIPIFALFGAFFIDKLPSILKDQKNILVKVVMILFVILSLFYVHSNHGLDKSPVNDLRNYVMNIKGDALFIVDSRTYRGTNTFMFHDKDFIETSLLLEYSNKLPEADNIVVKIYIVECLMDDCGWGTIKNQPDFNKTTENFISYLTNNSNPLKTFYRGGKPYFKIYETTSQINPYVIVLGRESKNWFYYPVNYAPKDKILFRYETKNNFDKSLNNLSFVILYLEILIAILCIIAIFIIFYIDYSKDDVNKKDREDIE